MPCHIRDLSIFRFWYPRRAGAGAGGGVPGTSPPRILRDDCIAAFSNKKELEDYATGSYREKISLFFLRPTNKWRGCGRGNGDEHKSIIKAN